MGKILNLILIELPGCWQVLSPTTPEIIDQIHELILEKCRISAKSIAEQLGISRERVESVIHEDLDILVVCFFPGRAKDLSASM
jgi:predicted HTH transcriptional regulator